VRTCAIAPLLAVLCLCACSGSDEDAGPPVPSEEMTTAPTTSSEAATTTGESPADTVELVPMPRDARRTCRSSARVRPVCPRLVPEAPYEEFPEVYVAELLRAARDFPEAFNLSWGAENPARPERNRPPRLSHVVVVAGSPGRTLQGVDARVLRRVTWDGRRGTLLLAASFPRGGLHGDHLVFRWRQGEREYAASLHAWKPRAESVETLEAIVASIPPGRVP
jgi:hypothetical protein